MTVTLRVGTPPWPLSGPNRNAERHGMDSHAEHGNHEKLSEYRTTLR